MFCPNCGKPVKENDNFCRYCGSSLNFEPKQENNEPSQTVDNTASYIEDYRQPQQANREEFVVHHYDQPQEVMTAEKKVEEKLPYADGEELVLYDIKKHVMALFWPICLTPVFFIYFWCIFLNTHSFLSWIIVFLLLIPIIYPILRFNSDKIVVTTKFAHIKMGILNPVEIDVPLTKINMLDLSQTTMGRILDYGTVSFVYEGESYEYGYIKDPGELQYLIDDPARYIREVLEEE